VITELDAVNAMLSAIGEAPVSMLEGTNADVALAQSILLEVSRAVQTEGWPFNSEVDYPLARNAENEFDVPGNTIRVDADGSGYDVALRDGKLFDRKAHSFKFPNTASLKVQLVILLPFSDLPFAARNYIMIRAARVFVQRAVGSDTMSRYTERDEQRARALLQHEEGVTADHTLFDAPGMTYLLTRPQRRYL
jgi:hypothetical protein